MGKIRILGRTQGVPAAPPPLQIKRKNLNTYVTVDERFKIHPGQPPKRCPVCLTEGKVVNCCEGEYHFRCTVQGCGYQW